MIIVILLSPSDNLVLDEIKPHFKKTDWLRSFQGGPNLHRSSIADCWTAPLKQLEFKCLVKRLFRQPFISDRYIKITGHSSGSTFSSSYIPVWIKVPTFRLICSALLPPVLTLVDFSCAVKVNWLLLTKTSTKTLCCVCAINNLFLWIYNS